MYRNIPIEHFLLSIGYDFKDNRLTQLWWRRMNKVNYH